MVGTAQEKYMDKLHTGGLSETTTTQHTRNEQLPQSAISEDEVNNIWTGNAGEFMQNSGAENVGK